MGFRRSFPSLPQQKQIYVTQYFTISHKSGSIMVLVGRLSNSSQNHLPFTFHHHPPSMISSVVAMAFSGFARRWIPPRYCVSLPRNGLIIISILRLVVLLLGHTLLLILSSTNSSGSLVKLKSETVTMYNETSSPKKTRTSSVPLLISTITSSSLSRKLFRVVVLKVQWSTNRKPWKDSP